MAWPRLALRRAALALGRQISLLMPCAYGTKARKSYSIDAEYLPNQREPAYVKALVPNKAQTRLLMLVILDARQSAAS